MQFRNPVLVDMRVGSADVGESLVGCIVSGYDVDIFPVIISRQFIASVPYEGFADEYTGILFYGCGGIDACAGVAIFEIVDVVVFVFKHNDRTVLFVKL